ncbi:hypothetical protein IJG20_01835 [Candidatus Saccharibacteria bacterium]|nr:hypothetical protein [Candidatus Saccharibacteria bacterium]
MEEKLYFKPVNHNKKKQARQRVDKNANDKKRVAPKIVCLLLFLLIVIVIIWLLRGKTTTHGHYPENVKNISLTCVSDTLIPPKLNSAVSDNREIKINAVFHGADELRNISLIYTLNCSSSDEAYGYEAKSHADFNKALSASGYETNKFKNKFSRYDNKLIINLSANGNEIDQFSAPYFMLSINDNGEIAKTFAEFKNNYETQGFICESTTNK